MSKLRKVRSRQNFDVHSMWPKNIVDARTLCVAKAAACKGQRKRASALLLSYITHNLLINMTTPRTVMRKDNEESMRSY